jgi:N-acetylglucosaminyldiphosphoundecaprenol N-acetyl-beta-D-mannosaminyltransferase
MGTIEKPMSGFTRYDVVGTEVSAVSMATLIEAVAGWRGDGQVHRVCFADVNSVMQARDNPAMREALATADVVSPDGTPLMLVGRLLRGRRVSKTSGPDFLEAFCAATAGTGTRHFFLGGGPGVAAALASQLAERYPGLVMAGSYSPPRFPLSEAQNDEMLGFIEAARPDVVWVGLGAPKQEIWMAQNKHRLSGLTLLGVGAAFDFSAGRVKRAPLWMQRSGTEWLYRIVQEPKRLFGRYASVIPRFLTLVLLQMVRLG